MSGRKIREYDEAGRLTEAGFEWWERSIFRVDTAAIAAAFGGSGVVTGFLVNLLFGPWAPSWNTPMIVLGFGGLLVAGAFWTNRLRPRSVIFDASGGIRTPQGLPRHPELKQVNGLHSRITSIEAVPKKRNLHWVRLLSLGGDTVYVARDLSEERALKVSAQLTRALADLRKEYGEPGKRSGPSRKAKAQAEPVPRISID